MAVAAGPVHVRPERLIIAGATPAAPSERSTTPIRAVPDEDTVIVIGGGVVGLASAYFLARAGRRSIVLEAGRLGGGASAGNAGWIAMAPPVVAPVPGPGVITTALRWMLRPHSPFQMAVPLDKAYVRWLVQFARNCSPETAATGLAATLDLNSQTPALFDDLASEADDFEMAQAGVLLVYRDARAFEVAQHRAQHHPDARVLSRADALRAEPLLSDSCAGAIKYAADRHLRPERLVSSLTSRLRQLNVEIREQTPCLEFERVGSTVVGVRTPDGTVEGTYFVLSAGVGTRDLATRFGDHVAIEAGRGYSFDVPRSALPLHAPTYIYEDRLALTPFQDTTRVAGLMQLGARRTSVTVRAIETMNRAGESSFRVWQRVGPANAWAGLRPLTPDGLPIIGPLTDAPNVVVASGHGMLGVTLSLRTGTEVARYVAEGGINEALLPFGANRFGRA